MSAMGSEGIKEAALQSASKAYYLAAELDKIGFKVENKGEFFHEFVTVSEKCPCRSIKGAGRAWNPGRISTWKPPSIMVLYRDEHKRRDG